MVGLCLTDESLRRARSWLPDVTLHDSGVTGKLVGAMSSRCDSIFVQCLCTDYGCMHCPMTVEQDAETSFQCLLGAPGWPGRPARRRPCSLLLPLPARPQPP
jgi:hypothetical protein